MTDDWSKRLNAGYNKPGKPYRYVRLPADRLMKVRGEKEEVTISLHSDAVTQNMQTNAAAFEGWSLALKYWCDVDRIVLEWQPPEESVASSKELHYQRFLYRVRHFQKLFQEWFIVGPSDLDSASRTLGGGKLYLNAPGYRRNAEDESVNAGTHTAKARAEHKLERELIRSDAFQRHYGFGDGNVRYRQFPVGLFCTQEPSSKSRIFPGGSSAIDLLCLDNATLWLFELKAEKNIPLGTVTELIFYTSVIRDAIGGRLTLPSRGDANSQVHPDKLRHVTHIEAVMLGHNLHPLLSNRGLINKLNDAARCHWSDGAGFPTVSFRAGEIVSKDGDPLKIRDVV